MCVCRALSSSNLPTSYWIIFLLSLPHQDDQPAALHFAALTSKEKINLSIYGTKGFQLDADYDVKQTSQSNTNFPHQPSTRFKVSFSIHSVLILFGMPKAKNIEQGEGRKKKKRKKVFSLWCRSKSLQRLFFVYLICIHAINLFLV